MYCSWRIKDSEAIKALRTKIADMEVVLQKVNDEKVNSIIIGTNSPCSGKDT